MAKKAKARRVREVRANRALDALPALSSLTELPAFDELKASDAQRETFEEARAQAGEAADELVLGCVVRLDRGYPAIVCEDATFRAEFATRLTKGDFSRVAVGDWVCARRPAAHEMGLIEQILPRESDIARWRGSNRGERQTLAANVDLVIVVQQLGDREVDFARVARSAVIVRDCGAELAVVLSKADRAGAAGVARDVAALREVLGTDVRLVVTSAGAQGDADVAAAREAAEACGVPFGEQSVRDLVPAGVVAIVLGESGAGKSTLLNALLGRNVLETGAVRASDDAGRHTTVARRMVSLPDAGVIVDEPGLRSLPLVGHERGLALVFPDIAHEAAACRFRDCTHTHEPGCAVIGNAEELGYAGRRLDAYLSLAHEMRASRQTLDPDVVI